MKPNKCMRCGRDLTDFTAILCIPCYEIHKPNRTSMAWQIVKASILFALAILLSAAVLIATN